MKHEKSHTLHSKHVTRLTSVCPSVQNMMSDVWTVHSIQHCFITVTEASQHIHWQ